MIPVMIGFVSKDFVGTRLVTLRRHSSPDLLSAQILCEQPISPFSQENVSEAAAFSGDSGNFKQSKSSKGGARPQDTQAAD